MSAQAQAAPPPERPSPAALVALAAIALLGLALRLRAIPGPWGTDALHYAEHAATDSFATDDPRSQRVLFIALVRLGLGLGGGTPGAASAAGVLLSAAVGPLLWIALRRRLGDVLALLPAALWAVLGLDVEEVVEVSADAALALPGALIALALCRAADRPERTLRWAVAGGLAAGVGIVLKETFLLPTAGFLAALAWGRPKRPGLLRVLGVAVATVAAVLVVARVAGVLQAPAVIQAGMASAPEPIRSSDPAFLERVTLGVPQMLVTADGAFGLLHVVALPLMARLPFRAARGDALAIAALVSFVAFDLCPVSPDLGNWAVLTTRFPRFVLPILPLWFAALTATLGEPPSGRLERWTSLAAAACALVFAGGSPANWVLVPVGAALAAGPCIGTGLRPVALRAAALALVLAAATAFATENARVRPDGIWSGWDVLPSEGAIHADRLLARRLSFAARSSHGADAGRLRVLDDAPPPPAALAPGDRVLARRGSALADACSRRRDLLALGTDLGEAVEYVRW